MTTRSRVVLILLLSAVSSNAMAEWAAVTAIRSQESPEIQIAYVDPASIHKDGNLVNMWVLVDHQSGLSREMEHRLDNIFSSAKGAITKSWKVQDEFDCKDKKLRMLSYTGYADHMGNGAIIPSSIVTGEWEPVIPASIGDALWKYACGRK